ncbi:MAG TPA: hypothetical protein VJI67_02320 [archaeon]|nr:hypothetical protein [archaeon]HLD81145.1 hypothetical protein [archaeon]
MVYVIIVITAVTFFALTQAQYIKKIDDGHRSLNEVLKREQVKLTTHFVLMDDDGNTLTKGDEINTTGIIVKNNGRQSAHIVSVYWVDWNVENHPSPDAGSNTKFCALKIKDTTSTTSILELKGDRNVILVPNSCGSIDTNVDANDYFIVHSIEKSFTRYL